MRIRIGAVILTVALIAVACNPFGTQGQAESMLPDVPNTTIVKGQTIAEYIASLSSGATLLSGNAPLVAAIEFAQGAINCYQEIGAVAVRIYSDNAFPLSSGMVVIVDRNAITDVGNLARCLGGGAEAGVQATVQVCTHSYTLKKDDNEFYIAYVGTTLEMCQAFCTRLQECTAHQP
ncbi:MAG TPA: hypothetical protein VFL17_21980 [Anaerolineae bacterium]|nr:hypothetical protein [Anaerolineae bacterium]